jgi:hypothetical protein
MPITDLHTVKDILQITDEDSPYNAVILDLIPMVQEFVVSYCNNKFEDNKVEYSSSTFTFTHNSGSADTIADSESEFVNEGFQAGDDIYVHGTDSNDDIYEIDTVAAGTLTLVTTDELVTESSGDYVTIYRITWPKSIEIAAAKMIMYDLKRMNQIGIDSENRGDYSVTFKTPRYAGYPSDVLGMLNPYRKIKCR